MKAKCVRCGSEDVRKTRIGKDQKLSKSTFRCLKCGKVFIVKPEKTEPEREESKDRDALDGMSNEESEEEEDAGVWL
jgi:uncharacterized Zn finger protein